jgi:F420H(2)-dependent quinone reductase
MPRKPPPADSTFWKVFIRLGDLNRVLFRATKGKVGGRMNGAPVLLLHHTGAKSGTERVSPLIYLDDGADLVVVASKGGVDSHPAWLHNLRAHPDTEVELVGGERRAVHARVLSDEERDRYWPRMVDLYKGYEDYQTYTERKIPLVVLEPR